VAPRYLFASPSDAALIVAVVQGRQWRTVEFFGLDADSETRTSSPRPASGRSSLGQLQHCFSEDSEAVAPTSSGPGRHFVPWMLGGNQAGWEAELWPNASDRNAMTAAAHPADHELGEDAQDEGSELSEGLRSLFAPPLKAIFTVRQDNRIAEVLRIRST
jgi:hypothetical protein